MTGAVVPVAGPFPAEAEVLIVGAGACGLTAALAARDAGAEPVVLERDPTPTGSTAMSSGFVPAPGTRAQRAAGVEDDPGRFAADLQRKAKGEAAASLVALAARRIGPTLDWLEATHGLEWRVLTDFLYPGHSRHRMHAVPEMTGEGLMGRLLTAVARAEIPVVTGAAVEALEADGDRIAGVRLGRPDGSVERIGCRALILACNGYGGDPALVAKHVPQLASATYWGHPGNRGDALRWGAALGAEARHLTAAQGHGSLADPPGALITWALIMEGGVQVNAAGRRFHDESVGYSEAALPVLAQPGGVAWDVFDAPRLAFARGFPDFRAAEAAGAVRSGDTVAALAAACGLPAEALAATLAEAGAAARGEAADPFGRDFGGKAPLAPPLHAVKVTGALFHTQGGLMIGEDARVLRPDGSALPNLLAGGGAACGVSGPRIEGYLSGNGLLTAIAFGAVAGETAARIARG